MVTPNYVIRMNVNLRTIFLGINVNSRIILLGINVNMRTTCILLGTIFTPEQPYTK